MSSNPVIVWFRRDLRLTDHEPLARASGRPVVPVFLADADSPGAAGRWWMHHSLTRLAADLARCGSTLTIRRGDPPEVLRELCAETGADTVSWHRVHEPGALALDETVEDELHAAGITTKVFTGSLLHDPGRFLKADGTPYRVFTPFWRALSRRLAPGPVLPAPRSLIPPARRPRSLEVGDLGLMPKIRWYDGLDVRWCPGERGALDLLDRFGAGAVRDYAKMRDFPAADGVSRLSPHLHFGEISPRQAWQAVAGGRYGESEGATAFLRQLGWREFAHSILFHFPRTVTEPLNERFASFPWRDDDVSFDAWCHGRTGYPLVDAGMSELWHTGWMHNRVRMVVASFLVKNLRLPWQRGASWFRDTLVDADLANNTLGWQWAAGCGADAAPYFRVFNPERQRERFDPDDTYVRHWVPAFGTRDYPRPMVDFRASREAALAALKRMGGSE